MEFSQYATDETLDEVVRGDRTFEEMRQRVLEGRLRQPGRHAPVIGRRARHSIDSGRQAP